MSLFSELKRRNVFRVGIAYVLAGWVLLQIADFALDLVGAPNWIVQSIFVIVLIGLPVALVFAWVFEVTPEGIRREKDVDRSRSIAPMTGRKLDRAIIGILVVALGWFVWDKFADRPAPVEQAATRSGQSEPVAANQTTGEQTEDSSIAVLPFTTRSTSEDDRFFSDGMHDDLLTQLAKIGSLKVISRTSVMEYRDTTKNLRQIGKELGAAAILEGAVQRVGTQVRINVQLIDADSDEHLWAETYDRVLSVDNLLAMQTEMARSIASALHATLSPTEEAALEQPLTDNLEALEAYRRANLLSQHFIEEDLTRAEQQIRLALELDPSFAQAWAKLAYIQLARWWGVTDNEAWRASAREAIDRGRALDPDLLELDIAEGYYHYWGFLDYRKALDILEPRLPDYPHHAELLEVTAYVNRRYGRIDQTMDLLLRVAPMSPRDLSLQYTLGESYAWLRRWDEAQHYLDIIKALDPTHTRSYQLEGDIRAGRDGDFTSAARFMELASQDTPGRAFEQWRYLVAAGDADAAMAVAGQLQKRYKDEPWMPPGLMRGATLSYFGQTGAAEPLLRPVREHLLTELEQAPADFELLSVLCDVTGSLGLTEEAIDDCRAALDNFQADAMQRPFHLLEFAASLGACRADDQALELLRQLGSLRGGPSRNLVEAERRLSHLHDHSDWASVMDALGPE